LQDGSNKLCFAVVILEGIAGSSGGVQSGRHRQKMAQGYAILLRRAEIGILGKIWKNRRVQILDQAAIDRNSDQKRYDAFGH
jgi:hypothetical protein